MKSKWTILLAVLLLAVLAMPELAEAQAGWDVERDQTLPKLIMGGNNQQAGKLLFIGHRRWRIGHHRKRLELTAENTITVTYGDLKITNSADSDIYMWCAADSRHHDVQRPV